MSSKPDREQIAADLGKNYGLAVATGNTKAAEIAARLIAKNERLAAEEQAKR